MKWSAFLRAVLRLRAQQSGVCLRQPNTPLNAGDTAASNTRMHHGRMLLLDFALILIPKLPTLRLVFSTSFT